MPNPVRVLVPIDSHSDEALPVALGYASAICQKAGVPDIVLLTHTSRQLEHTSLARILGSGMLKALAKGPVNIQDGLRLRSETMRTIRSSARQSAILVYYASTDILDLVDGLADVVGVVAVPDLPGTADEWADRWNVITHGHEKKNVEPLISDPVVVRALQNLTSMINLSTGLGHPRDKDHANEVLRILRAKGHEDPSSHIKSWAIRNGWRPDGAAALESLSRKIWGLKTKPSLADFFNPHERYQRWRDGSG